MSDDELGVALLESLQRANPVPVDGVGGRRDLPSAHALFAEITTERPRRVRRRTMVIVIALVILLLASLLGAFALVQRDEPTVSGAVECAPSATYPIVDGWGAPSTGDPIAACEAPWHNGVFGTDGSPSGLDSCVMPTGVVGVFPGEYGTVCKELGFSEAATSGSLRDLERFTNETASAVEDPCVGYEGAVAVVEQQLAKYGYAGWTIQKNPAARPANDERPCSSISVVPDHRTVLIVPIGTIYPGQSLPTTGG